MFDLLLFYLVFLCLLFVATSFMIVVGSTRRLIDIKHHKFLILFTIPTETYTSGRAGHVAIEWWKPSETDKHFFDYCLAIPHHEFLVNTPDVANPFHLFFNWPLEFPHSSINTPGNSKSSPPLSPVWIYFFWNSSLLIEPMYHWVAILRK